MLPAGTRCPASAAASSKLPVHPLETLHDKHCPRSSNAQPAKRPHLQTFFSSLPVRLRLGPPSFMVPAARS